MSREDLPWLLASARGVDLPERPELGAAAEILDLLDREGALFFSDLCTTTGRMPVEVAEALWDGVARGLITADGFGAVRVLLSGRYRSVGGSSSARSAARRLGSSSAGRRTISPTLAGGRWSMLRAAPSDAFEPDELAEATATQLLQRWGIALRELYVRESFSLPWRDVLWALRRFEARGLVRGGRFVAGTVGEQFALPEALDRLREVAASPPSGTEIRIAASDPLNLTGIIVPGPRIPAVRGRFIILRDGVPSEAASPRLLAVGEQ
jgi:ATP-dependent Lhr-like helicase